MKKALFFLLLITFSSCGWHARYLQNIKQGEIISESSVTQLRKGMTKDQVDNILGSPLLTTINPDRWEYVYYRKKKGTVVKHKRLIIFFEGQRVQQFKMLD